MNSDYFIYTVWALDPNRVSKNCREVGQISNKNPNKCSWDVFIAAKKRNHNKVCSTCFFWSILCESTWDYQHLFGPWAKAVYTSKVFPLTHHGQWHKASIVMHVHKESIVERLNCKSTRMIHFMIFMDSISSYSHPMLRIIRISHNYKYCVSSIRCKYRAYFTHCVRCSVYTFICLFSFLFAYNFLGLYR